MRRADQLRLAAGGRGGSADPSPRIHAVSTVRDSADNVLSFLAHHAAIGVERFYLFVDAAGGGLPEALTGLEAVTLIVCDEAFWSARGGRPANLEARQVRNASQAFELARDAGADWLLHLDSDEAVFAFGDTLDAVLARVPEDVGYVRFPTWEALGELRGAGTCFDRVRHFRTQIPAQAQAERWARRLGCRRSFRYGYFRGHRIGKSAVRTTIQVEGIDIHGPRLGAQSTVQGLVSPDAVLLHYDGATFESWRSKWQGRLSGATLATEMRPDRRRQLQDFAAAQQSRAPGALRREYARQCLLPWWEFLVLWRLGLIRRVDIDRGAAPRSPGGARR